MRGDQCKVAGCANLIKGRHGRVCGSCKANKARRGCYTKKFSPISIEEKFSRYVDRSGDCHLWVGYIEPAGYGKVRHGTRNVRVHRMAYEMHLGSRIPNGFLVLHSCDVRNCVNIEHLRLGTYKDNVADMYLRGRESRKSAVGSMTHSSVFTEADIPHIRRELSEGKSIAQISRERGVSTTTIFSIKHNRTWRHVS